MADQMISAVLRVERTRIRRLRQWYLAEGLEGTLADRARSGRPIVIDEQIEAAIVAIACK